MHSTGCGMVYTLSSYIQQGLISNVQHTMHTLHLMLIQCSCTCAQPHANPSDQHMVQYTAIIDKCYCSTYGQLIGCKSKMKIQNSINVLDAWLLRCTAGTKTTHQSTPATANTCTTICTQKLKKFKKAALLLSGQVHNVSCTRSNICTALLNVKTCYTRCCTWAYS
jgi:hypothetical protein